MPTTHPTTHPIAHRGALAVLACLVWSQAGTAAAMTTLTMADPRQGDWSQIVQTHEGPATVAATTRNGAGDELGAWRVSFALPETTAPYSSLDRLALVYNPFTWTPAVDGGIARIEVAADLRRVFSTFASGVAGFVRPILTQSGDAYSVSFSDIVVGPSLAPQPFTTLRWSLAATDSWVRVDGSQGSLDLSAQGAPLQFGIRWGLATSCTGARGCSGASTVTGIGDLRYEIHPTAAVPEPGTWALMLAGLAAVGRIARRRHRAAKA